MSNPWLWLGILVTGVVGLYGWEYRRNPGQLPWQISSNSSNSSNSLNQDGNNNRADTPSTDELLASLTPEEQAVAAELDNVDLLLAQLDADVTALTTGGETSAAAALNTASANVEAGQEGAPGVTSATGVESSVERLTRYIDQYQFLGARTTAQTASGTAQTPVQRSSSSAPTSDKVNILALGERLAANAALSLRPGTDATQPGQRSNLTTIPAGTSAGTPAATANETSGLSTSPAETSARTEDSGFSFDPVNPLGGTPGQLNGLNQPFIRTTPNMSPPPGTTGYTPPTSVQPLNQPSPRGSTSGTGSLATPSSGFSQVPTIDLPQRVDRTQVLPPASQSVVTPLEPAPLITTPSQTVPRQPRNAWEDFFD